MMRGMSDAPQGDAALSTLLVRTFALVMIVVGIWLLIGRGMEWSGGYDKVYLREFVLAKTLTPAVAVVIGIVLRLASRPLGRWLARGL